jgi:hypothetical protein
MHRRRCVPVGCELAARADTGVDTLLMDGHAEVVCGANNETI